MQYVKESKEIIVAEGDDLKEQMSNLLDFNLELYEELLGCQDMIRCTKICMDIPGYARVY